MKLIGAVGISVSLFGLLAVGCSSQSSGDPDKKASPAGASGQSAGAGGAVPVAGGAGGAGVQSAGGMPGISGPGGQGVATGAGGRPSGTGGMAGMMASKPMGTVALVISAFPEPAAGSPGLVAGVNQQGQPQTYLIRNTGTGEAVVSVMISDSAMGQFVLAYDGCVETFVPPQGTCQVDVRLKPSSLGPRTGALKATSGAAMATFALMGTGILAPNLMVMPTMHDFGTVAINTLGVPKVFTFSNTGMGPTGALSPAEALGSSAWKVKEDKCMGMSLAPGQMCTVTVNIEPTSVGMKMGTLTLTSPTGAMVVAMLLGNVP